jgi:MFS superfamily sulfate permease-like transporter
LAVCCFMPDLHPCTTVLGELSQTMHQNFQQTVSNIFTKLRGSNIYIILFILLYICVLYLVVRWPILTKNGIYVTNAICIRLLNVEDLKTHEIGTTTLILNVRNHITSDNAAHRSRTDTSPIPLQKP